MLSIKNLFGKKNIAFHRKSEKNIHTAINNKQGKQSRLQENRTEKNSKGRKRREDRNKYDGKKIPFKACKISEYITSSERLSILLVYSLFFSSSLSRCRTICNLIWLTLCWQCFIWIHRPPPSFHRHTHTHTHTARTSGSSTVVFRLQFLGFLYDIQMHALGTTWWWHHLNIKSTWRFLTLLSERMGKECNLCEGHTRNTTYPSIINIYNSIIYMIISENHLCTLLVLSPWLCTNGWESWRNKEKCGKRFKCPILNANRINNTHWLKDNNGNGTHNILYTLNWEYCFNMTIATDNR